MVSPDVAKYGLAPWPLIIIPIPFLVVALIALLMRMWVRIFMTRSFGYDDGFLIAAYVSPMVILPQVCMLTSLTGRLSCRRSVFGYSRRYPTESRNSWACLPARQSGTR